MHSLRGLDSINDFTEELHELCKVIDIEANERETDDLGIVKLINDVCIKMYNKFNWINYHY